MLVFESPNKAVVTNIALHCFDIADSGKCSFCETERETLLHLFCACSSLILFWENVISWTSGVRRIFQ